MHSTGEGVERNTVRFLRMKAIALLFLVVAALLVSGCESDMPAETNRENPIQRGIRGEGTLTQRDYSDDPYVR